MRLRSGAAGPCRPSSASPHNPLPKSPRAAAAARARLVVGQVQCLQEGEAVQGAAEGADAVVLSVERLDPEVGVQPRDRRQLVVVDPQVFEVHQAAKARQRLEALAAQEQLGAV